MRKSILKILYDSRFQTQEGLTQYEIENKLKNVLENHEEKEIEAALKHLVEGEFIRQKKIQDDSDEMSLYEIAAKGIVEAGGCSGPILNINQNIIMAKINGNANGVIVGTNNTIGTLEKRHKQKLGWEELKELSLKICYNRLAALRDKFSHELYLQRKHVLSIFKQFLSSEKKCFILTGNSGVGKSSFVVSLLDEYGDTSDEICIIGYNGGTIDAGVNIDSLLKADFENNTNSQIENVLKTINLIENIQNRTVLLIFDAINENPDPKSLFFRINQMVESAPREWKWLKILITSRPEAWKTIKRGINLAESHYFTSINDSIRGHESFLHSLELTRFQDDELCEVYEKYSKKYNLKTSYDDLNTQLKDIIGDPLMMWLISTINTDKFLPIEVQSEKIFEEYLNFLLESNRLEHGDLDFLRNQIMPLLINREELSNRISFTVLDSIETGNGFKLSQLIKCRDTGENGKPLNQSFQNLCDAKIMQISGKEYSYEIGFEFERFYDFFAGNHLFDLYAKDNPVYNFIQLSSRLDSKPFLWGPIINALKLLLDSDKSTVDNLAFCAEKENLKDLLVYSITDYGRFKMEETEKFMRGFLISTLPQMTKTLKKIFQPSFNRKIETRTRIALEVAYNLPLKEILEIGTNDSNSNIRSLSVRFIFYLAQKQPDVGISILNNLKMQIGNNILKINWRVLESFLGVSFLMFFKYYTTPKIKSEIMDIWKFALKEIGFVSAFIFESTSKSLKKNIKRWIFWICMKILFLVQLKKFEKSEAMIFSRKDLNLFFKKSSNKVIFSELIPYIDNRYGSIFEIKKILTRAALENDLLTMYTFSIIFTCRLVYEKNQALDVAFQVHEASLKEKPATSYIAALLLSFSIAIFCKKDYGETLWEMYEKCISDFYLKSKNVCRTKKKPEFVWSEQGRYHYFRTLFSPSSAPIVTNFIKNALEEDNHKVVIKYIKDLTETIIRFGISRAMVEHLLSFTSGNNKHIKDAAINAMRRLRNYYKVQVDDILREQKVSPSFEKLISSYKIDESIGDLIVRILYEFWRDNLVIYQDENVLNQVMFLANKAMCNKSIGGWIKDVLENILMQIGGNK